MNATHRVVAVGLFLSLGLTVPALAQTTATSVPAGATECGNGAGNICTMTGNRTVYYGAGAKWGVVTGTGSFTCLPKGWQKDASKPKDLGIDDPAPGVVKKCFIVTSGSTTPAPATPAPVTPAPVTPAPVTPTPATPAAVTPAPASGVVTAVPSNAKECVLGTASVCSMTGNWTTYYGAGTKYAVVNGTGNFTCLPKGWVKDASKPKDLGVDDPVPGGAKKCFVVGTMAAAAAATPVTTPAAKVNTLPLTCTGSLFSTPTRNFTSTGDFDKNGYLAPQMMTATNPTAAADECKALCAKTGEPAPCGWYTVVQWMESYSATGKSQMTYGCYRVNARDQKGIFKPVMSKETNFGSPSNGLNFKDSWTYSCVR